MEIYREIDMILDIADRKTLYRNTVVKPMEHDLIYKRWLFHIYVDLLESMLNGILDMVIRSLYGSSWGFMMLHLF